MVNYVAYSSNVREFFFFNTVVSELYVVSTEWIKRRERVKQCEKKKCALVFWEKKGEMTKVVNGMIVPQFSKKTNHDNWCLQMKTLLGSQDIWDVVESRYQEPAEDANQTVAQITTLKKIHRPCTSCIMRCMSQASRRL